MAAASSDDLLLRALEEGNPDLEEYPRDFLACIARLLAEGLAATLREGEGLPARVRSLCFNLRANQPLRRQVCAELISPHQLCEMDQSEWASSELQSERQEAAKRQFRSRVRSSLEGASHTRSVRCKQCGACDALFVHVGAQKDGIGKVETWGRANDDALSTLIECCQCGNSWHTDAAASLTIEASSDAGRGPTTDVPADAAEIPAAPTASQSPATLSDEGAARLQARAQLTAALLEAAGGNREHDAFLGSSPDAVAARIEAALWAQSRSDAAAYEDRALDVAASIDGQTLDQLAMGELQPRSLVRLGIPDEPPAPSKRARAA